MPTGQLNEKVNALFFYKTKKSYIYYWNNVLYMLNILFSSNNLLIFNKFLVTVICNHKIR